MVEEGVGQAPACNKRKCMHHDAPQVAILGAQEDVRLLLLGLGVCRWGGRGGGWVDIYMCMLYASFARAGVHTEHTHTNAPEAMKSSMPFPTSPVPPVTSTTFLLLRDIAAAPVWLDRSIVVRVRHHQHHQQHPLRIIMGLLVGPLQTSPRPASSNEQPRTQSIPKEFISGRALGRVGESSERPRDLDDERARTRSCPAAAPTARTHGTYAKPRSLLLLRIANLDRDGRAVDGSSEPASSHRDRHPPIVDASAWTMFDVGSMCVRAVPMTRIE